MRKLDFVTLQVSDLEKSKQFYTDKLSFEVIDMGNPDAYIFKFNKGQESGFCIRKPFDNQALKDRELGIGVSLWFAIDEKIEDLFSRLKKEEVSVVGSIKQTPFGQAITVIDPDGYNITLIELK